MFIPLSKSFTLVKNNSLRSGIFPSSVVAKNSSESSKINDDNKRKFLKILGGAGLGAVALSVLPEKANALVIGNSNNSTPIGIKNSSNVRINPATEETLQSVKTNTDNIAASTSLIQSNTSSIQTNTANIPSKGQATMSNSMPVVIASNQTAIPISGSMSFDASSKMTVDAADSLFYLRKIVKLLEPVAVVDSGNRQRVVIDSSSTLTVTLSTNAVTTVAGQGTQMYQDVARNTYATGIRNNLSFA